MLVTSRTPLRVSFFGGGTDYPEYFSRSPGAVVGMAIDRYIYVNALKLANFIDYRYRLSYSRLEQVHNTSQIEHPVVRCVLQHYRVEDPLDISIIADLPSCTGLGSSSAFTVGLINLIQALRAQPVTRLDLGLSAINVEQELLQERVGCQDQLHAAFGGMNRFDFIGGRVRITPIQMRTECLRQFMSSLVLIYTGITRHASEILEEQCQATAESKNDQKLHHLHALTAQAVDVLEGDDPDALIGEFGAMLHDGWMTKRTLASNISSPRIDQLYQSALDAGALGGKLCGAGGGGFLLMVVPPSARNKFDCTLSHEHLIPITMDTHGSTIISS